MMQMRCLYEYYARGVVKVSMIAFCIAVPLAFVHPFVSLGIYIIIAIIWFMPERALEHALMRGEDTGK